MSSHRTVQRCRPPQSPRKFYFLDYFYILLKSVEKHSLQDDVFSSFRLLKQEYRLGESKYKRLTSDGEALTAKQQQRYRYTFRQVVDESRMYRLVSRSDDGSLKLTDQGREILEMHDKYGFDSFLSSLATLMEEQYGAFRYLVEYMYQTNERRSGVLIFPHYSPLELGFQRSQMQTTGDFQSYAGQLVLRLEDDIRRHLHQNVELKQANDDILNRLINDDLLPQAPRERFVSGNYNKITKRIRDFWIMFFLKILYECPLTMSTFDLWVYRAKQVGIIHATEFYPFSNGKLVYPTAVVLPKVNTCDFRSIHRYDDGNEMFLHDPKSETFMDQFVRELVKSYFDLRAQSRNYFINLSSLREAVCYGLKISSVAFERMLNDAYRLNLQGELRISISLEVDKLPEETNAMYLKREPVMVDGSYRNIIAIDVTKGVKSK